jgi:predicted amidophosphoribosyltransferase
MNCPSRQRDNVVGAKFCSECGSKLAQACVDCGAALAAGILAQASTALGNRDEALAAFEEAQSLMERTGSVIARPLLHERRAEFAQAFESDWDADAERRLAVDRFRDLGADGHVERITGIGKNTGSVSG